eukprot:CAMPEP_0178683902 /NCGR_PEP_ID=MMETSP0699-20121125/2549_1 /TAXON_ID=265572 /ORGANISM="Extubocellulus spinifer, Strain CCMP396" /LENGTH=157 /DNA_ID=CAMNT_0020328523 /DNA_START=149 /DNA_END=623 /DNA_ORIENTATION=-
MVLSTCSLLSSDRTWEGWGYQPQRKSRGVLARRTTWRLGPDKNGGVIRLSNSHINKDILINNKCIVGFKGSRWGHVIKAVITDTIGSTGELNKGAAVGGSSVGEGVRVGGTNEARKETFVVLEDEELNASELILEEKVLQDVWTLDSCKRVLLLLSE